ncbi:MAG: sulfotransferase [Pseudomonadota bacterium]
MNSNRFVFLGGCPRSGTTLVQNMLDSHPHIAGGPEFLHLVDIVGLRNKLHGSINKGWIDLFCSAEQVDDEVRRLIETLLLQFVDAQQVPLLSEKSPENILVFSELVQLFPEAKFIHIFRDPRAVVASLLATGARARAKGEEPASHTADLDSAVRFTRSCLRSGLKAEEAWPGRIHRVCYEELVEDPEGVTRSVCEYLEVPWSSEMLRPGEHTHAGEAAITVRSKEIWYDRSTYYSNPDPAKVDKWRTSLTLAQQVAIEEALRGLSVFKRFGYDLSMADSNGSVRKATARALYLLGRLETATRSRMVRLFS